MASSGTKQLLAKALTKARSEEYSCLNEDDLLLAFPQQDLLKSLEPEKRLDLIETATGIKRKILVDLSLDECAMLIGKALKSGASNPLEIFGQLTMDGLVGTQDLKKIWRLIYETCCIPGISVKAESFMIFLIEEILDQSLLGPTTGLELFNIFGPKAFFSPSLEPEVRAELVLRMMMRGEPLLKMSSEEQLSAIDEQEPRPYTARRMIKDHGVARLCEQAGASTMAKILEVFAKHEGLLELLEEEVVLIDMSGSVPPPAPERKEEDGNGSAEASENG